MKQWTATDATKALWRERVHAWRASGETATAFAAHEQYAPSTLRYWSSVLNRPAEPTFLRVVRRTPGASTAPEMIVEVGGARVRVARGFDAALLGEIVVALSGGAR